MSETKAKIYTRDSGIEADPNEAFSSLKPHVRRGMVRAWNELVHKAKIYDNFFKGSQWRDEEIERMEGNKVPLDINEISPPISNLLADDAIWKPNPCLPEGPMDSVARQVSRRQADTRLRHSSPS